MDSQLVKALNKGKTASSVEEMRAQLQPDPTIVATAFNKRRFYLFTRRMPDDVSDELNGRDVLNEKPTAEEAKGRSRVCVYVCMCMCMFMWGVGRNF